MGFKNIFTNSKKIRFAAFLIIFLAFLPISKNTKAQYSDNGFEQSQISPLMMSVNSNDIDGVKFFAKAGRSVLNKRNIGGATALHIAARKGNIEIIKILVNNGADLNIKDNEGWTPLMRAASNNNSEIVSELIAKGANANLKNNLGQTAILHSTQSSCLKCLDLVLQKINYKKFDEVLLEKQFEASFLIANKKGDGNIKDALSKYKDGIGREDYPMAIKSTNNNLKDITPLKPAIAIEKTLKIVKSPEIQKQEPDGLYKFYRINKKDEKDNIPNKNGYFLIKNKENENPNQDKNLEIADQQTNAKNTSKEQDLTIENVKPEIVESGTKFLFKKPNINEEKLNNSNDNKKFSFIRENEDTIEKSDITTKNPEDINQNKVFLFNKVANKKENKLPTKQKITDLENLKENANSVAENNKEKVFSFKRSNNEKPQENNKLTPLTDNIDKIIENSDDNFNKKALENLTDKQEVKKKNKFLFKRKIKEEETDTTINIEKEEDIDSNLIDKKEEIESKDKSKSFFFKRTNNENSSLDLKKDKTKKTFFSFKRISDDISKNNQEEIDQKNLDSEQLEKTVRKFKLKSKNSNPKN